MNAIDDIVSSQRASIKDAAVSAAVAPIVADGRERFEQARGAAMKLRQAEVAREVEARFAAELATAGVWRRWQISRRIRKEVTAILRKELPSPQALFIR